jgi:hypothetical protein
MQPRFCKKMERDWGLEPRGRGLDSKPRSY